MSVYKRGNGANYYIQFIYNGKMYLKSAKTTNLRVAERMEREWKTRVHAGEELGERPRITLKQALVLYVSQKSGTGSSDYAKRNAKLLNDKFPTHLLLDEIQDWHLTRFKAEREQAGTSAQTIKHNFNAIRGACKVAKDNGYQVTVLEYPKLKLPKHRLRYLSPQEEKRLLAALDPMADFQYRPAYDKRPALENQIRQDNYDLVVMLLDTGARYSELANIKKNCINLEQQTISLWRPKVRNESVIYMTARVRTILQRRMAESSGEYLFNNRKGKARGYSGGAIRNAFKRADIQGFTIHDLRHTCATRLIQNGMSLYEVSQILGHVDIQTTQRYAHLERVDVSKKARDLLDNNFGQVA